MDDPLFHEYDVGLADAFGDLVRARSIVLDQCVRKAESGQGHLFGNRGAIQENNIQGSLVHTRLRRVFKSSIVYPKPPDANGGNRAECLESPETTFNTFLMHIDETLLPARSEEHTSELKSLMRTSYAVLCLKKTTTID